MIKSMKAIEYNTFMSLLQLLSDRVPYICKEYNLTNIEIPVLPKYPPNLTDMKKPSIIMRKVDTTQSKIGMGNVLGQHYDAEFGGYVDVVGKLHNMMVQFDVVSHNNSTMLLLESMIADDIFNQISYEENGRIVLYDYTKDINNPEPIGYIKIIGDPDIYNFDDDNKSTILDHYGTVRHEFSIVQTIVPHQDYVDLSKWIKQSYTIKV